MNFLKTTHRMSPFLLLMTLTVFPENAWAVQSHGAPEGLYVHQLAHIFYTAAMCYLIWGIRQSAFKSQGWRYLQICCVFMILWNIVAFTGHSLAAFVDSVHFTREGGYLTTRLQGPLTNVKLWFYFTKLDHLFSVPALYFLYLAMKGIYRSSCEEEKE
ncbi:hypothetical protein [Desulfocapsa sulfexigens]|nr:hypothetical protein [Desulfocapsa sulfexigens]